MSNSFPGPGEDKYFEDYEAGRVYELGSVQVELAEVVEFATRYDPQYFHIDESRAKESIYGGIIASGWHTASMMMRVFADNFLSDVSSMGSPGLDELRWYHPVRPGDTLFISAIVLETRLSKSKLDRGVIRTRTEVHNQRHALVLSSTAVNFMRRRQNDKT